MGDKIYNILVENAQEVIDDGRLKDVSLNVKEIIAEAVAKKDNVSVGVIRSELRIKLLYGLRAYDYPFDMIDEVADLIIKEVLKELK